MIGRVAVNPASLEELCGVSGDAPAEVFVRHRALCELLHAHGALVIGNHLERQRLIRAIAEVAQRSHDAGLAWRELIKLLSRHRRAWLLVPPVQRSLEEVDTLEKLRDGWRAQADVAVLTAKQAELLGVGPDDVSKFDPPSGLDLTPVSRAMYSRPLTHYRKLRDDGTLPYQTDRDVFWGEVLEPISHQSTEIVLYDRYLFTRLADRRATEPTSRSNAPEHVAWLLSRLDATGQPGQFVVTLMGCYWPKRRQGPSSAEDVANLIDRYWTPEPLGAIRQLDVVTAPFSPSLPHDRHVRFSLGVAIMIKAGFDRLQRPTISAREGVAWTYEWTAPAIDRLLISERQMREDSTATFLTVLST